MSFLSKIFKRKPGGTVLGNIIRAVAHVASGGILGNGWMMIKPGSQPSGGPEL